MTVKEFKQSYFCFSGRLNRKPFLMRLMMLGALSIFFVLIVINAEPHLKEDPAHFAENVRKTLTFWVYYIPLSTPNRTLKKTRRILPKTYAKR